METKKIVVEVESNLGSLKSQLREAQAEVSAMSEKFGATSTEAINAAKAAARLKDTIGDAKAMTDAFNPDAKFKALTASMSGALNGFQAVEGAMGLFGAEGEDVQKMLLKVQSAMALAQGVDGLLEAKDAFKTFGAQASAALAKTAAGQWLLNTAQIAGAAAMRVLNLVMAANPIFLIIAAFAALIGALAIFSRNTGNAKEAAESYTKSLENQRRAIDDNFTALQKRQKERLDLMKIQGASEKQLFDQEMDNTKKLAYEKGKASVKEKYNRQNLNLLYKQLMDQGEEEEAAKIREQLTSSRNRYNELKQQSKDYYHQLFVDNKNFVAENKNKVEENEKKVEENARDVQKRQAESAAERWREKQAKDKEASDAQIQKAKEVADALIAEEKRVYDEGVKLNEERIKNEDAQFELERELTSTAKDKEIEDLVASYDAKYLIAVGNAELEALLAEQQKTDIAAIDKKYLDEKLVAEKEAKDKQAALDKEELDKKKANILLGVQMGIDALSAIGDIAEVFAGDDKKRQKNAFNIKKAANIAQATMDTFKGAQSAFADTPGGPVIKGIAAGIAGAVGFANIAKIAKTKFDDGGSGGGGGGGNNSSSLSALVPTAPTPANFNLVGNSNTNQLLQGLQNQPIQAYVVGGDVTSQQSLDRNKITTASI